MIEQLAQRKYPLMINVLLLFILIQKSFTVERTPELFYFFCGGLISTLFALIFLYVEKKVSLHMLGVTSLTIFMTGFYLKYMIPFTASLAFLLVIVGLVGSSRLHMKAHTLEELFWGILCGAIPQLFFWMFWL